MSTDTFLNYSGLVTLVSKLKSLFVTAENGVADIDISGNAATADNASYADSAETATTATKLGTSTVGSGTKPIYLSSGTATASSSTVGSSTSPVYLNAGTITECGTVAAATKATQDGNGKTISSTYLPLSGGTMTGEINTANSTWNLYSTNTSGLIRVCGGGFSTDGSQYASSLFVYGNAHSTYPGYFRLRTGDTTNSYTDLVGKPDGSLTWGGKTVERVNGSSFSASSGYIKYASGFCLQWGIIAMTNTYIDITFPTPFTTFLTGWGVDGVASSSITSGSGGGYLTTAYGASSTTKMRLLGSRGSDGEDSSLSAICWFAIGYCS